MNSRISNSLMKNSSDSDEITPRILNMSSSNNYTKNSNNRQTNFYSHIHDSHDAIKKTYRK